MPKSMIEKLLGNVGRVVNFPSLHNHLRELPGCRMINAYSGEEHWFYQNLPFIMRVVYRSGTPNGWRVDYRFEGEGWSLIVRVINIHVSDTTVSKGDSISFREAYKRRMIHQIFNGDSDRFDEDLMTALFVL